MNRACLVELTEVCEEFISGHHEGDVLGRLRRATLRARTCLDVCEPDDLRGSRAGYAAGRAAEHSTG